MRTTPPTDAAPLPDPGFGELRCRRYLFQRDWWDQAPPAADSRTAERAANPAPLRPPGGSEPH